MANRKYITPVHSSKQSEAIRCFSGGFPLMPARCELPICELCGARQTFFFQVLLTARNVWSDRCLLVFHCTDCADEQHFIPPMLADKLPGIHVPKNFPSESQKNFRVVSFSIHDELVLRTDLKEKIRFEEWRLSDSADLTNPQSFIGGYPEWMQEDETPGEYGVSGSFEFLLQIAFGTEFNLVDEAPGQVTLGLDKTPRKLSRRSYRLFLGNQTFFFGAVERGEASGVYVITQRD